MCTCIHMYVSHQDKACSLPAFSPSFFSLSSSLPPFFLLLSLSLVSSIINQVCFRYLLVTFTHSCTSIILMLQMGNIRLLKTGCCRILPGDKSDCSKTAVLMSFQLNKLKGNFCLFLISALFGSIIHGGIIWTQ